MGKEQFFPRVKRFGKPAAFVAGVVTLVWASFGCDNGSVEQPRIDQIPTRPVPERTLTPTVSSTPPRSIPTRPVEPTATQPLLTPTITVTRQVETATPVGREGVSNMALVLDGENDYLEIENSENLHLVGKIVIEARILLEEDTFPPSLIRGGDVIITKGEPAEFALYARKLGPGCERKMGAVFNGQEFCSGKEVPIGQAVDLKVTYDGDKATFFIDGQEVSFTALKTQRLTNEEPVMIGTRRGLVSQDCGCKIDRIVMSDDRGVRASWEFNGDLKDSVSGNDAIPFGNAHLVEVR